MTTADRESTEQWGLIRTPVGQPWSGRTRYAAAMYFHKIGKMDAETLEIYRICSRLDAEDPLSVLTRQRVGQAWLALMNADKQS